MKLLPCLVAAVGLLAAGGACAQEPDFGAGRERIQAERAAVEARFAQEQQACRGRFAVTDCMRRITSERNANLADLRRQENALNDAQRRRREEQRQREAAEREARRQQDEEQRRERGAREQKGRDERAAGQARPGAAGTQPSRDAAAASAPVAPPAPQGSPRAPRPAGQSSGPTAEEAARNRQAHEKRLQDAEAHRAEVRARIARRARPAASGLPVPATPASGS